MLGDDYFAECLGQPPLVFPYRPKSFKASSMEMVQVPCSSCGKSLSEFRGAVIEHPHKVVEFRMVGLCLACHIASPCHLRWMPLQDEIQLEASEGRWERVSNLTNTPLGRARYWLQANASWLAKRFTRTKPE